MTMTKTEFARHMKVSAARVSQWIGAGMPVGVDGSVTVRQATDWVAANIDRDGSGWGARKAATRKGGASVKRSQTGVVDPAHELLLARARKLAADARRAERIEDEHAGELLRRSEVEAAAFQTTRTVRDFLLNLPARLTGAIVAEICRALERRGVDHDTAPTVADLGEIERLLEIEIRTALHGLADSL